MRFRLSRRARVLVFATSGTLLCSSIALAPATRATSTSTRGGRIAFVRTGTHPDEDMGDVYVMNGDGSGQQNVTRDPAFYESVVWSPDGRRLAFAAQKRVKAHRDVWATNVYVMNADGSGLRRLTWTAWSDHPVWSPDGRRIAFLRHSSKPPGNDTGPTVSEIYVINADGTRLRRRTRNRVEEYALAWSKTEPNCLRARSGASTSSRSRRGDHHDESRRQWQAPLDA